MTLSLLALLSGVAYAQDDARARELYGNGVILYEEGRYSDALLAWEEAYRLSGRHVLLFNMANAMERDGQYGRALETLNRYRAYAPADERETLDRRIRNLEQRIRELPLPLPDPVPDPRTVVPDDPVATPAPPTAEGASAAPWLMLGGGAALVANGAFFGLRAVAAREEAGASCTVGESDLICQQGAGSALRQDAVSSIVADVSFVLGTGLGLGGVVLLARDGQDVSAPVLGFGGRF